MKIWRILWLVAVAGTPVSVNAALIDLTFSGVYQNPSDVVIFGESGDNIPFSYTMTYDTSLDTNTQFYASGDLIGTRMTNHPWYGYSASGIVASDFSFGTKSFSTADILAGSPGTGALADLWFDTDIALAAPTLTWIFFRDADGDLAVGGGYINLENVIFLGDVSYLDENDSSLISVAGPLRISGASVPSPATLALVGLGLVGLVWQKHKRA